MHIIYLTVPSIIFVVYPTNYENKNRIQQYFNLWNSSVEQKLIFVKHVECRTATFRIMVELHIHKNNNKSMAHGSTT